MKTETALRQPTIEFLYHWVLRIAALVSGLNAVQKLLFYLSISLLPDAPVRRIYLFYLLLSIVGAAVNISAWALLRHKNHSSSHAFLLILFNLLLVSAYFFFTFRIYEKYFTLLILSVFVVICLTAGILCNTLQMVILSIGADLTYLMLFVFANRQKLIQDPSLRDFLPHILIFYFVLTLFIAYISQKMQAGEKQWKESADALTRLNRQMESAQEILSHYVAPQLARKIFEGQSEDVGGHCRRKLTLFFSDIKDFTATCDSMEAEDMVDLLNGYLDEMVKLAIDYGGTVAQISGDGLFVFFGAPEYTNDRDHALQCVRMGMAMQKEMEKKQKEWFQSGIEHPFRIRCGINTGLATVGGFGSKGRKEYTAIGLQVNLAARLEAACEPGQILISHTTWGLINEEIPCTEKESITVKGFHRPIRTYQVDL